ncbi:MAG TPA: hypothetical protein VHF26_19625, partial [Trebonia sp.]|nr:hypothetical protein [Trebonia sp.]
RPDPATPPAFGARPGRPGGTHERSASPMNSAPATGHGDPLAERPGRDGDRGNGTGLIDPDEPTEGIRLLS